MAEHNGWGWGEGIVEWWDSMAIKKAEDLGDIEGGLGKMDTGYSKGRIGSSLL